MPNDTLSEVVIFAINRLSVTGKKLNESLTRTWPTACRIMKYCDKKPRRARHNLAIYLKRG